MARDSLDGVSVLIEWKAFGAKSYALIYADIVSNDACFADDDTRPMIHKQSPSEGCAGMDVNSGGAMGVFADHAWDYGHVEGVQLMGDPVTDQREQAGVTEDHFVGADTGRITQKGGVGVADEHPLNVGEFL